MSYFKTINPPEGLSKVILGKIDVEISRRAKVKAWFFRGATSLGTLVFVLTLKNLVTEFYRSGLNEYLSLAFSDFGTLATYWSEFLLSIAEVFPAVAFIAFLSAGLFTLWSLGNSFSNIKQKFLLA